MADTGDFDLPGYMSPDRGEPTLAANRWGHTDSTGWTGRLLPDRVVRTYEGYGVNPLLPAHLDENLVQTGVWIVDSSAFDNDLNITLKMRDVGRLLIDQIVFPPAIPYAEYPLSWETIHKTTEAGRVPTGGAWTPIGQPGRASSSNRGKDPHPAAHAADGRDRTYWQSSGQPRKRSVVWWQSDIDPSELAGVRIDPRGGPYHVYISVKGSDGWIGRKRIPTQGDDDANDRIPFVKQDLIYGRQTTDVVLPRVYKRARAVRITVTRLHDTGIGERPFVAMLQGVQVYVGSGLGFGRAPREVTRGNYRDFTDIVKWCCAWGGFYWPTQGSGQDFMQIDYDNADVSREYFHYLASDNKLPKGRVWGDFMATGTAGEADLTVDLFDKKPLMDVIAYVRDMVGFLFFIDETGGVVWRMPNLWEKGNYRSPGQHSNRGRSRTDEIQVLDERTVLESWTKTYDGKNLRERIFVANTTGKIGTVIKGFMPEEVGYRRVAGWTDQHFETQRECRVMADMISAQQMFSYARGSATIKANPAIQIDDQVRIFERVTNETRYHYVESINSTLDMESGTWDYELTTHWLGERPRDAWAVNVEQLDQVTQAYLNTVGVGD